MSSALPDTNDNETSISRNCARLCTLFQTFSTTETTTVKSRNNLYVPVHVAEVPDSMEAFLQIGEKRWSECQRTGSALHSYYLLSALGYSNSLVSSMNIDLYAYNTDCAMFSWDTERCPQAIMTSHNCASGALITACLKTLGTATTNRPTQSYVSAHYDCVFELSGQSAQVHTQSNKWADILILDIFWVSGLGEVCV